MRGRFHQQIWLKCKEETSEILLSENSFVMVLKTGHFGNREKIPGNFWNVVVEKGGEDQVERSCEKWRSITWSQGGEEYPTYNKKKEG
jgi:hypothetical protein